MQYRLLKGSKMTIRPQKNSGILFLFLGCIFSSIVYAEMYKWVDDEGNTYYSQSPPVDETAEVIEPPPKIDTDSARDKLEKRREAFKLADEAEAKSEEEAQKKAEEEAIRKENCRISKSRLDSLQNSRRIRAVDEEGNITRATEEEHQSRIDKVKENIQKYCD
jgi:hypothetical protein